MKYNKCKFLKNSILLILFFSFKLNAQSNNVPGEIGINNAQIFYYHQGHEIPKNLDSKDFIMPYLAYVDQDGGIQDYLMDTFLLYDVEFYGHYFNENSHAFLDKYLDNTFTKARMISVSSQSYDQDGSKSAFITKSVPSPRNGIAQKFIEITDTNIEYTLSCYSKMKSDANTNKPEMFLAYELFDADYNEIKGLINWQPGPDVYFWSQNVELNWGRNEFKFNVPSEAKYMSIHIGRYDTDINSIFVDNVSLNKTGDDINLIQDGNFLLTREMSPWVTSRLETTWGNDNSFLQNFLFKDRKPALSILANAKKIVDAQLGKNQLVKVILPISKPSPNMSLADYQAIVVEYLNDIEQRFHEWKQNPEYNNLNIEISGIYYAQESPEISDLPYLEILKSLIHAKGWLFVVSPYNNPTSRTSIGPKGFSPEVFETFDVVWQQPNVFFRDRDIDQDGVGENIDLEMLNWIFTEVGKPYNMGINIENRKVNIVENEPYGRILDYFDYGYKYGYVNTTHCYYDDQGAHFINSKSSNPLLRQDYNALYDFIRTSKAGKIVNGDFEIINPNDTQRFYNWVGNYSIQHEPLYTANNINRSSKFTNNASTNRIVVDANRTYSIGLKLNESINQSQYSALYGMKFFDKNGNEIIGANGDNLCNITNNCSNNNIRYSSYLGIWYEYINPTTEPSNFNFGFNVPLNAVSIELFFNKWGNGSDIIWNSINIKDDVSNELTHFYYYENSQKLFGAYGDFGDYNKISLSAGSNAITEEKISLIGGSTYELTYATKEELPLNCSGFDSLFGFEFYDRFGNKINGESVQGLTWSSYLEVYYNYIESSQVWNDHKRQFIAPTNAVSAKLLIQNWNCDDTIYFDNINLNIIQDGSGMELEHSYGWKNGFDTRNILDINNWNTNFPLMSSSKDKPSYYKQTIDVSCAKNYTFSMLVKEILDDGVPNSALFGIEIFDENWNIITNEEASIPGLIWSDFYQLWYYYINIQYQNVTPFYLNDWQDWSRNFVLPSQAYWMKLGLFNWSPDTGNVVYFQRPMLFGNDNQDCGSISKRRDFESDEAKLNKLDFTFKLHPNPNKGEVTLSFSNQLNNFDVVINDMMGREIRRFSNINSNSINLSTKYLTKGIYIISIKNLVTSKTYSSKMIVR